MKICAISDIHEQFRTLTHKIKDVDVLVVAGDLTYHGELEVLKDFNEWVKDLKKLGTIKECIVTPGNHDKTFENKPRFALDEWNSHSHKMYELAHESVQDYHLLIDKEIAIDGIKFYGTPWTPCFGGGWSFQLYNDDQKREAYNKVPSDTDVWIGHGPPFKCLDWVNRKRFMKDSNWVNAGCPILMEYIEKIKPKYYLCGHLHDPSNHHDVQLDCGTTVANVAICDEQYKPIQEPFYFEINKWDIGKRNKT